MPKRRENKEEYFKGSLIAGAVGDALGYAVEFTDYDDIIARFGKQGITDFVLAKNGKAVVSDDTQMTIFTARGILDSQRKPTCGFHPSDAVFNAYKDWLFTQNHDSSAYEGSDSIMKIPALYVRRAPGGTCLSALEEGERFSVSHPANTSKGCGSVMRLAPYALAYGGMQDRRAFLTEAAEIGAITHGHPLSHLSCAYLASVISQVIYSDKDLHDVALDALDELDLVDFVGKDVFCRLIDKAITLSSNDARDVDNIGALGGGWVAEEAVAIALYCSLRHKDDTMAGIIAAVNHSGDSDSTGAITGNILGALNGVSSIPKKYLAEVEFKDLLTLLASLLAQI